MSSTECDQNAGEIPQLFCLLTQFVPMYSVKKIVQMFKSLTSREIFRRCPHVAKQLWGGEFWSDGYFASTGLESMEIKR